MLIKAVLWKAGKILGEFPIQVEGKGDLAAGTKEAFEAFRKALPNLSLFDDDVRVSYEKMDDDVANRS